MSTLAYFTAIVTCQSRIELQPTPPAGTGQLRCADDTVDVPGATAVNTASTFAALDGACFCGAGASELPPISNGDQPCA